MDGIDPWLDEMTRLPACSFENGSSGVLLFTGEKLTGRNC
jgi:hypothetical protein